MNSILFLLLLSAPLYVYSYSAVDIGDELWVLGDSGSCFNHSTCTDCTADDACAWCPEALQRDAKGKCASAETLLANETMLAQCKTAWCGFASKGKEACKYVCESPCSSEENTFPCSENVIGQLLLMVFYGALLGIGAKLISDGSEMILELFPSAGTVIGALLLPILGAVPDAAIILMSGAAGSLDVAQEQLTVGVGTLAGSTIMLLTIAWCASSTVGRCDFNEFGEAQDGVCEGFSLFRQGISVDEDTPINARIMILTALAYVIVQSVEFATKSVAAESSAALIGMIFCIVTLVAYCTYQVFVPKLAQKRLNNAMRKVDEKHRRLRALQMVARFPGLSATRDVHEENESLVLSIATKWKRKALNQHKSETAGRSENTPLLGSIQEQRHSTAYSTASHDEEEGAAFWKEFCMAIVYMVLGTGIVVVFSDPIVDVISDFGKTVKVPAFYVSFIVTPFCSNASELISSIIFASKKKMSNASLTFSQIYGAVTLNNTLCLGIFYALVHFRGLHWNFGAETVTIFFVIVVVGVLGSFKRHFRLIWSSIVILYPVAIGMVYGLKVAFSEGV